MAQINRNWTQELSFPNRRRSRAGAVPLSTWLLRPPRGRPSLEAFVLKSVPHPPLGGHPDGPQLDGALEAWITAFALPALGEEVTTGTSCRTVLTPAAWVLLAGERGVQEGEAACQLAHPSSHLSC